MDDDDWAALRAHMVGPPLRPGRVRAISTQAMSAKRKAGESPSLVLAELRKMGQQLSVPMRALVRTGAGKGPTRQALQLRSLWEDGHLTPLGRAMQFELQAARAAS